jgi:hypothetical protein
LCHQVGPMAGLWQAGTQSILWLQAVKHATKVKRLEEQLQARGMLALAPSEPGGNAAMMGNLATVLLCAAASSMKGEQAAKVNGASDHPVFCMPLLSAAFAVMPAADSLPILAFVAVLAHLYGNLFSELHLLRQVAWACGRKSFHSHSPAALYLQQHTTARDIRAEILVAS